MGIAAKCRNFAFWTLDTLKGGAVKKELKSIQSFYSSSKEKQLQEQRTALTSLLHSAVTTTEFYKEYSGVTNLEDYPVVDKNTIKANFKAITSKTLKPEKLISVSTSGSTGTPFKVYQTSVKKKRNTADTLYFAKLAGFTIGQKLLYLRFWAAYYKKPKLLAYLQNTEQLDVSKLTDDYIKKLVANLQKDSAPKGWLGYPSGFETICKYLDKVNAPPLDCNVQSTIAIAEGLSPTVQSKMEYYFKAPTVSRYSNVENGILAQQLPKQTYFTINWASYRIEILDLDKDIPAKKGALGRIVVTDLYNTATHMIRYDTGDVGSFYETDTTALPMLKSVEGRKMDVLYKTNGDALNPFTMHAYVYDFHEVEQLQFIQTAEKEYQIKINTTTNFLREDELVALFKNDIGTDATIHVDYVHEIASLKSGKRKIAINHYKKSL
ncbi:CoF synthetase [Cellulophaga sp. 20_2_10]|uniref:CoF synthetase n=1 Tax=Cellulophaga sp. 20_2_10 TaxID=2942476 RepID=UPI00201A3871|nr:CoF synthetase [Cellulophaga sp. 20_2_10]MCL5244791.1 CoF synthetase [Cellulophaga sp. 20_2_10]